MENHLPDIQKLDGSNWSVWKLQLQAFLQASRLWDLCTGNEKPPTLPTDKSDSAAVASHATALSNYQVREARVKSILYQMVSVEQLHVIAKQHLLTPKQMWDELLGTFERPSLSNKL